MLQNGTSVDEQDTYNFTALHCALAHKNFEMTKFLIGEGANVNMKDLLGMSPLHYAAKYGNLATVKLLLENGASINDMNGYNSTALIVALANE